MRLGTVLGGGQSVLFFVEGDRLLRCPVLVEPGVAGVAHNSEEPSAAVATTEAPKELEGAEIGLLHHIFRILVAARQPPREIVCGVHVGQDRLLKPRELAGNLQLLYFPLWSHEPENTAPRVTFYSRPLIRRSVQQSVRRGGSSFSALG